MWRGGADRAPDRSATSMGGRRSPRSVVPRVPPREPSARHARRRESWPCHLAGRRWPGTLTRAPLISRTVDRRRGETREPLERARVGEPPFSDMAVQRTAVEAKRDRCLELFTQQDVRHACREGCEPEPKGSEIVMGIRLRPVWPMSRCLTRRAVSSPLGRAGIAPVHPSSFFSYRSPSSSGWRCWSVGRWEVGGVGQAPGAAGHVEHRQRAGVAC